VAHSTWVSQHLERWRALADACLPSPKLPLNRLPWRGAERARVGATGSGSHRKGVEVDYDPIPPDFSLDRQPKGLRIKQLGHRVARPGGAYMAGFAMYAAAPLGPSHAHRVAHNDREFDFGAKGCWAGWSCHRPFTIMLITG